MHIPSSNGLRSRLLRYLARRQLAKEELFQNYIKLLIRKISRSTILIFGSRARGDFVPYSDYDVAVILTFINDKLELIEKLRRLKPKGLDLDLIVLSINDLRDPIVKSMLSDSKILYDGLGLKSELRHLGLIRDS